jgi:thiol-disulfide isomerase/thioredoxin
MKTFTAALCAFTLSVFADEPGITPDAERTVAAVAEFHKALKSASASIVVKITQDIPDGPKGDSTTKASFSMARPNKMDLRFSESANGPITFVSDGRTVWVHAETLGQYIVDDAPKDLETLLRDNSHIGLLLGEMGPIGDLFRANPRGAMLSGVTVCRVVGTEKVAGVECTRLHGEQAEMDWDAWFQTGPQPALRRFVFSPIKGMLAGAPEELKARLKNARIEAAVSFDDWKFDAAAAAGAFAFEPPKGAKKVAHFAAEEPPAAAAGPGAEPGDGPEALKGKPGADFALDLLAGGRMQLGAHKGKDVVILDFWATWCGPCVRALPEVAAAVAGFKGKGVVLYAVNQQEEPADVKKLEIAVAMDVKGEAAKLYKVRGIPQTVIIGKDGNIAGVHVGYGPGLKERLTKEIEALLK